MGRRHRRTRLPFIMVRRGQEDQAMLRLIRARPINSARHSGRVKKDVIPTAALESSGG